MSDLLRMDHVNGLSPLYWHLLRLKTMKNRNHEEDEKRVPNAVLSGKPRTEL
jgi:hypothetical protein